MASEAEIEVARCVIRDEIRAYWEAEPEDASAMIDGYRKMARLALEAAERVRAGWTCKAQRTADPPQDCNWPFCGCDPGASKVLHAIAECGYSIVPEFPTAMEDEHG